MKNFYKNIKLYIGISALALFHSCKPEIELSKPNNPENINFSKFIAIGSSLTAGYADGGLYLDGQINSFPNLIASKLQDFGSNEFKSPFFTQEQLNGTGYIKLKALVNGQPVTENITNNLAVRGLTAAGTPLYTKYTDAINNLGVPGMRLDMAFAAGVGTTAGNPYFERLLPEGTSPAQTYLNYATTQNHTFFSFNLGNDDVLGYATNGGVTTGATNTLTNVATFKALYTNFINALTSNGQKGVVSTIPDVTSTPYFTTVTRKALLAAASAAAGSTIENLYITTKNTVRAATDKDFFVLPFSSAGLLGVKNANQIPYGLHPYNPIADQYVLDETEATQVVNLIKELNTAIKDIANSKNLAVADIYSFLNKVKDGYNYNGIAISNKYITGNAFSLDGIHLTPMGYAIMSNLFIDAINSKYKTNIDKVDATLYRGVKFP